MRPLTSKDSIHFVLRSTWAMGSDSFLARRNRSKIDQIINRFAKKFGVRIYQRAINSNHLHLLLRITNRRLYRSFIKAASGQIASHVMGQQSFPNFSRTRKKSVAGDGPKASIGRLHNTKSNEGETGEGNANANTGVAIKKNEGFWEFRPFSRIVNWGKDFKSCVKYLKQNVLEAFGVVVYRPRKDLYAAWMKSTA